MSSSVGKFPPPFSTLIINFNTLVRQKNTLPEGLPISALTFRRICTSAIWSQYLEGILPQEDAFKQLAEHFHLSTLTIEEAFTAARSNFQIDKQLLDTLNVVKATGCMIYIISNGDQDVKSFLSLAPEIDEALLDGIMTSSQMPWNVSSFEWLRDVINALDVDPRAVLFVDNNQNNILMARSLGMRPIFVHSMDSLCDQLRKLYGEDPIQRGRGFLRANQKNMYSVTSRGFTIHENFSQLLIWEATGDRLLVEIDDQMPPNFFRNGLSPPELAQDMAWLENFPYDYDTTSIAMTITPNVAQEAKDAWLDKMLDYRTSDGLLPVYLDPHRVRIDLGICINVLTFFHRNNRGDDIRHVYDWVYACLRHRAYAEGSYYYSTETILYYLSRFVYMVPSVRDHVMPLLRERVMERFGADGDGLGLAMRLIAAAVVGLDSPLDYDKLLSAQHANGSWSGDYYIFPRTGLRVGNDGLATALALNAMAGVAQLRQTGKVTFSMWEETSGGQGHEDA